MNRIIYGQDERLIPWAERVIGVTFRSDATAIGVEDSEGTIKAVVVYDGFGECDCNMHVASDGQGRWLNREALVHFFSYPFIQCGFRRVNGLVPAKNVRALSFDLNLGFVIEGKLKDALPDDDLYILGMTRDKGLALISKYAKGNRNG